MGLLARLDAVSAHLESISQEVAQLRREVERAEDGGGEDSSSRGSLAAVVSFLALSPSIEEDQLLNTILRCAMHATGARGAGLTLFDRQKQRLVFRAAIGDGAEGVIGYEVPLEGSMHGLAFATGEIQVATPLHKEIEQVTGAEFRNVLVAPLLADGEPVGTLSAVNKEGSDTFTTQDMEAYKLFSDLAALVVRQRIREQQLRKWMEGQPVDLPTRLHAVSVDEREQQLMQLADKIASLAKRREGTVETMIQILDAMS